MIIEPVAIEYEVYEIDSTNGMLSRIDSLNEQIKGGLLDRFWTHEPSEVIVEPQKSKSSSNIEHGNQKDPKNKREFPKHDIRSFGRIGQKLPMLSDSAVKKQQIDKVESLRNNKQAGSIIPDIGSRVKAGRVIDKMLDGQPIKLLGSQSQKTVKKQKPGMSVVGSDVKSLFPSLKSVESARLAKHAILKSTVQFENVDFQKALRYIYIVGGRELLEKAGLTRVAPVWRGDRDDLLAVGGKKSKDPSSWRDSKRQIWESEKRAIVATVVEIAITAVMATHVYTFGGRYFLQKEGGPIGLRSTACLASLIMKIWDLAWVELLNREGICISVMLMTIGRLCPPYWKAGIGMGPILCFLMRGRC